MIMTQLAIIDLDGVIADNTKRFEKAEEAKQAFLAECRAEPIVIDDDRFKRAKEATNLYWQTVFTPDLVALDTLIEGAGEAIEMIEKQYDVIYLTSRPETMRLATHEWLWHYSLSGPRLIMKPPAAQYVKTVTWKALTIQMLVSLFEASEVLIVDDEGANLAELQKYDISNMRLCSSLAEVVKPVEKTEDNLF